MTEGLETFSAPVIITSPAARTALSTFYSSFLAVHLLSRSSFLPLVCSRSRSSTHTCYSSSATCSCHASHTATPITPVSFGLRYPLSSFLSFTLVFRVMGVQTIPSFSMHSSHRLHEFRTRPCLRSSFAGRACLEIVSDTHISELCRHSRSTSLHRLYNAPDPERDTARHLLRSSRQLRHHGDDPALARPGVV